MGGPYILRSGVSALSDLVDGIEAKISPGTQKVHYVNGITWTNGFAEGDDGNQGDIISKPLATLTQALSLCTNEGNDAIVILDFWAPTNETWPIAVDKTLVSIYGVGKKPLWSWAQMYSASDVVLDITGSHVLIDGLGFTPASGSPCVTFDGGCNEVWINGCDFHSGTTGIKLASGDMAHGLVITNNHFFAALSAGGIDIDDDVVQTLIQNNIFGRLAGDAINVNLANTGYILDNTFAIPSNGQGLAVTLQTGTSAFMVDRNHALYGEVTSTSPYHDEGTSTTNGWGLNYLNLTAITQG
jgi:hypothetical protein